MAHCSGVGCRGFICRFHRILVIADDEERPTVRLDAMQMLIRGRAIGLGDGLAQKIHGWKHALRKRVLVAQIALVVLALGRPQFRRRAGTHA